MSLTLTRVLLLSTRGHTPATHSALLTLTVQLQITYSGQEKSMASISAEDPRNQAPRARIAHVIQMNLDSPSRLQAAFKRAFGALLATDNKEYLDVGSNAHFVHTLYACVCHAPSNAVAPVAYIAKDITYIVSITS